MTGKTAILIVHIACGTGALILGLVSMFARKYNSLHTKAGEAYHWTMLGLFLTASTLAILDWARIWWFLPVAAGSYAFALVGYVAAKRRRKGWLHVHITGQGGSYIAALTALLIVNWENITGTRGVLSPWAWALPTVVGSTILFWLHHEVAQGRRPKPPPRKPRKVRVPKPEAPPLEKLEL